MDHNMNPVINAKARLEELRSEQTDIDDLCDAIGDFITGVASEYHQLDATIERGYKQLGPRPPPSSPLLVATWDHVEQRLRQTIRSVQVEIEDKVFAQMQTVRRMRVICEC